MVDVETLQAIRDMMNDMMDQKLAPVIKDLEAVKVAVLDIDQQLLEIRREIADMKAVVATNAYEIALLKTKVS